MSKFEYSTNIGDYNDPVKLGIELRLSGPLSKEDYDTLKNALDVVEQITYKYEALFGPQTPKDES